MAEKIIIFEKCELQVAGPVSNGLDLNEITNLGFSIKTVRPLKIMGKQITKSAIIQLAEFLNNPCLCKPRDDFGVANVHDSKNYLSHKRNPSPSKQDDLKANLDESFVIIGKDTNISVEGITCQFNGLSMKSKGEEEKDTTLPRNTHKDENLIASTKHVCDLDLVKETGTTELASISNTFSEELDGKGSANTKKQHFNDKLEPRDRCNELATHDNESPLYIDDADTLDKSSENENHSFDEIKSGGKVKAEQQKITADKFKSRNVGLQHNTSERYTTEELTVENDGSGGKVSEDRKKNASAKMEKMIEPPGIHISGRNEEEIKFKRSMSDNSYEMHKKERDMDSVNGGYLKGRKVVSVHVKDQVEKARKNSASSDRENIVDTKGRNRSDKVHAEEEAFSPCRKDDNNDNECMPGGPIEPYLNKLEVKKEFKEKTEYETKEEKKVIDTELMDTSETNFQNFQDPSRIEKGERSKSPVHVKYTGREDDYGEKKTVTCVSKLSDQTDESSTILVKMEEDLMKNKKADGSHSVIRMNKKKFLAAQTYFKKFDIDLFEYSEENGEDFEIRWNEKTHQLSNSQIKDFKLEEIPLVNFNRAFSAKDEVTSKFKNVDVKIVGQTGLIFGMKKDVLSAKKAFLNLLGNQDEINMWTNDDSSGSGKDTRAQSAQKNDSTINETKNGSSKDNVANCEDTVLYTADMCNSSSCRKKEVYTNIESGAQQNFESRAVRKHFYERGQHFYVGSKTNFKVYVRKENITKLDVGIIVNAANRHLRHGGGVAKAIASAAGQSLVDECNSHITTHGPLDVTDVFVSNGGLLRAKFVMHAVGPKWIDYPDKHQCLTDLRRTVIRCLVEASRLQKVSIALSSISAAIYKVPKELCAQCYMEAVKCFDDFADKLDVVPVKDIRFVDIDDDMVNIIQETFINEWHEPVDGKIVHEDFKFAQQHISTKSDDKSRSSTGSSAFKNKYQQPLSQGTKSGEESHKMVSQGAVANTMGYLVNTIQIHIVTKPATVYRSAIVVVGQLFDELSGLKNFKAYDSAKPRFDLPKQKKSFKYLSLSKPDGGRPILICQLHPNPDSPENVTKAFGNLDDVEEIHKSSKVVFTSAILYAKPKKGQDTTKIISRIAQKVFDFAAATSPTNSAIKSILIATGADCIPHVIKIFDSRKVQKIPPGQTSRAAGHQGTGSYPATSGCYPATSGGYPTALGGYPGKAGGSPDYSSAYKAIPGFKQDLGSSVDSQDCCSVCFESINILSLKCCQALICSTCLGKVSSCPFCRFHFKILIGKQPNGEMRWKLSRLDVDGYERKGRLEIDYYFPSGKQTEELQHPSPGKPYTSVTRTAYLPATDDGYRALRLLRVAFHRRLIFTIDVSHTTQYEGIVWNIHHKTSPYSSEHGYPDPNYLMNLMSELRHYGVTEDSMTQEEKRLVDELLTSLRKNMSTRV